MGKTLEKQIFGKESATTGGRAISLFNEIAAPQPEVPFFPFIPAFPKWELDLAYTSSDYLLINNNATTEKDPLLDNKLAIPFISAMKLKEIQYIVDKAPGEIAWMFLGKQLQHNSRHFLLYDFFLARQDASAAHVSLDMEDVYRYTKYLTDTYPDQWTDGNIAKALHHGHSHVNMAVHFSNTDHNQQEKVEELGFHNDYRFFLVFNKRKEVRACLVNYFPVFYRIDNLPVGIYTGDGVPQGEISRDRTKELDEQMRTLVKQPSRVISMPSRGMPAGWDDGLDFYLAKNEQRNEKHTKHLKMEKEKAIERDRENESVPALLYNEIMDAIDQEICDLEYTLDYDMLLDDSTTNPLELAAEYAAEAYAVHITDNDTPPDESQGFDVLIENGLFSHGDSPEHNKTLVSDFLMSMARLYYFSTYITTEEIPEQPDFFRAMKNATRETGQWITVAKGLINTQYWYNLYHTITEGGTVQEDTLFKVMLVKYNETSLPVELFTPNE